ncbi:MAG: hypothetical protein JWM85_3414 [Acidimicrobiaceae bacterium]|nr:hypothetical protein [Acidimicrobiaceae bacterium]
MTAVMSPAALDEPFAEPADKTEAFRDELFAAGLLVPTGVDGLYLRSEAFESIVRGIDGRVTREAAQDEPSASYHFPLVVPAQLLEDSDYVRSFPNLVSLLDGYVGGTEGMPAFLEAVDHGRWNKELAPTGLGLNAAACHPLYPTLRGSCLAPGGVLVELVGQVFRREPSVDPARLQVFRQHEVVFVGEAEAARAHRDLWVERGLAIHRALGLDVEAVIANDPFFGRTGRMLAANQRDEALKLELVAPIVSPEGPTAISSANCHLDHFGKTFEITCADGSVAHSACVGFGLERITLALLFKHGLDSRTWPASVRAELWP